MSVTLTVVLRGGTTLALRFVGDDCEKSASFVERRLRRGDGWVFYQQPDDQLVMIKSPAVDALLYSPVEGAA